MEIEWGIEYLVTIKKRRKTAEVQKHGSLPAVMEDYY